MMKILSPKMILLIASLTASVGGVIAQDAPPPQDALRFEEPEPKPNLLENLGLSRDQIRQIRMLNRHRKPRMEAAQQRLRDASRALDMSIYGDVLDENAVQSRLKEFQEAQGEIARIRFESELQLRKILTPEQLGRFRMLRARVAEARQNAQERRQGAQGQRPLKRIRQLPNRQRIN